MKTRYKILIVIALMLFIAACVYAKDTPLDAKFVSAIHKVETGGRTGAIIGDNGAALGPLQIHYDYWLDSGVSGKYQDCTNLDYSIRVMTAYLNRYAKPFIIAQNYQALARIHNGGPAGYKHESTLAYWHKVHKRL